MFVLAQLYGREPSSLNASPFNLPEYDEAIVRFQRAATEAEQLAAARKMSELDQHYIPMIPTSPGLNNDLVQPWVMGFYPSPFLGNYWNDCSCVRPTRPKTLRTRWEKLHTRRRLY